MWSEISVLASALDPKKPGSKVLKISRAQLLVPLKTCFTDKANTSSKPMSVAFYTLLQYNFLQNTIDVLVAVSLKRLPDGVSYNQLKVHISDAFSRYLRFSLKYSFNWLFSLQQIGLIYLLLFIFPFTDFCKTQRDSVIP